MEVKTRDRRGRFSKSRSNRSEKKINIKICDHDYIVPDRVSDYVEIESTSRQTESWKIGRRVVEFSALIDGLKYCAMCRLGPIPLCSESVVGELKKGLGGYLYIKCMNIDCEHVNTVAYGKLVKGEKQRFNRPSSFAVNTKLGTAMIDSLGGPRKVNHMLAALNIPTISGSNLKIMERRAGKSIEKIATESMKLAAQNAFGSEME